MFFEYLSTFLTYIDYGLDKIFDKNLCSVSISAVDDIIESISGSTNLLKNQIEQIILISIKMLLKI